MKSAFIVVYSLVLAGPAFAISGNALSALATAAKVAAEDARVTTVSKEIAAGVTDVTKITKIGPKTQLLETTRKLLGFKGQVRIIDEVEDTVINGEKVSVMKSSATLVKYSPAEREMIFLESRITSDVIEVSLDSSNKIKLNLKDIRNLKKVVAFRADKGNSGSYASIEVLFVDRYGQKRVQTFGYSRDLDMQSAPSVFSPGYKSPQKIASSEDIARFASYLPGSMMVEVQRAGQLASQRGATVVMPHRSAGVQ